TVLRATREIACQIRLVSFDHTLEPLKFALKHAADLGYFGGYEKHLKKFLSEQRVTFQDGEQSVDWEFHLGDFPALLARELDRRSPDRQVSGNASRLAEPEFGVPPHAI